MKVNRLSRRKARLAKDRLLDRLEVLAEEEERLWLGRKPVTGHKEWLEGIIQEFGHLINEAADERSDKALKIVVESATEGIRRGTPEEMREARVSCGSWLGIALQQGELERIENMREAQRRGGRNSAGWGSDWNRIRSRYDELLPDFDKEIEARRAVRKEFGLTCHDDYLRRQLNRRNPEHC